MGSWLLFARTAVTRTEVSDMIAKESPLAIKSELTAIRNELVGLRADLSRLLGKLETRNP